MSTLVPRVIPWAAEKDLEMVRIVHAFTVTEPRASTGTGASRIRNNPKKLKVA